MFKLSKVLLLGLLMAQCRFLQADDASWQNNCESSSKSINFSTETLDDGQMVHIIEVRAEKNDHGNVTHSEFMKTVSSTELEQLNVIQECFNKAQTIEECKACEQQEVFELYKKLQTLVGMETVLEYRDMVIKYNNAQ